VATGPRLIAVVLTGSGNDGATGATAVHRFGGTVIASSPQTSTYAAMPRATIERDHAVDHVVALDDIAGLLLVLTSAPRAAWPP
jgi:two-component system chemotaxis response regulator CheB